MEEITLTMTLEEAKAVATACDLFANVSKGHFSEISFLLMMRDVGKPDYHQRRDKANKALLEARNCIFPELKGPGHSHKITNCGQAEKAYAVFQRLSDRIWKGAGESG